MLCFHGWGSQWWWPCCWTSTCGLHPGAGGDRGPSSLGVMSLRCTWCPRPAMKDFKQSSFWPSQKTKSPLLVTPLTGPKLFLMVAESSSYPPALCNVCFLPLQWLFILPSLANPTSPWSVHSLLLGPRNFSRYTLQITLFKVHSSCVQGCAPWWWSVYTVCSLYLPQSSSSDPMAGLCPVHLWMPSAEHRALTEMGQVRDVGVLGGRASSTRHKTLTVRTCCWGVQANGIREGSSSWRKGICTAAWGSLYNLEE